jgi:CHAT domain-containing protein
MGSPFSSFCIPCLFLLSASLTFAQTRPGPYEDAREQEWAHKFLAGDYQAVIHSVETDLLSGHPHPFAPNVWTMTHDALGDLESAWRNASEPLRHALGPEPEIFPLYDQEQYSQLLAKYPAAKASQIKDVWALDMLQLAAGSSCRYQEAFEYQIAMAKLDPDNFLAAYVLNSPALESAAQQTLKMISSGGELADTAIGKYLAAASKYRPRDEREEIAAISEFLSSHPHDAFALRAKAERLDHLNLEAASHPVALASSEAYPFWANVSWYGMILIYDDREEEAKAAVAKLAAAKRPTRAEAAAAELVGRSFLDAGRRGEARRILEAGVKKFPSDPGLVRAMLDLESATGRHEQAVTWAQKLLALSSKSSDRQKLVYELNQARRHEQAIEAYKQFRPAVIEDNVNIVVWAADSYSQLDDHETALQLFSSAAHEVPESQALIIDSANELVQLGRYEEAWKTLQQAYSLASPSAWGTGKIAWLWKTAKQPDRTQTSLDWLLQKYPWNHDIWKAKADSLSPDKNRQIAVWEAAAAKNPGCFWPYDEIVALQLLSHDWDAANKTLAHGEEFAKSGPPSDRLDVIRDSAYALEQRSDSERVSTSELEDMLQTLERYRSQDGDPESYHRYRAAVLNALGRRQEAAQESVAEAEHNFNCDKASALFNSYEDADLPTVKKFEVLRRCVDRDPYEGNRLEMMAERQVQWGGSPIVALHYIALLKERAPAKYSQGGNNGPRSLEAKAWGDLGDNIRDFEFSYENAESIATSDRYLGWYDVARQQAQGPNSTVEVCDPANRGNALLCDEYTFKITRPDGQIEYRRDNPFSGKRELYQVGAAWIRAEYDDIGNNLLKISSSGGNEIKLTYDAKDLIQTLVTSDGQEVDFSYNEARKPTLITVKQVGAINVSYKPDGEIEKVDSTGGRKVALEVTSAFQSLMDLIQPFQLTGSNHVPDLPLKDTKRDSLKAAANNPTCEEPTLPAVITACAQHRIALAQYLVAHAGDKASYQAEAHELIEGIYNQATDGKISAVIPQAIDAVGLWYTLMRNTRRDGLPTDEWVLWNQMRDWVRVQGANPALSRNTQAVLQQADAAPLKLLETAHWYPHSYLASPGFWRRFHYDEMLPSHARRATQNAIFVRQNHDVLVGTARGLSVFAHGHWEWFGFDDNHRHFSSTLAADSLTPTSDIVSFAESEDGTLFVGTGDGLIAVRGEIDARAQIWKEAEGLSFRRIDHVAALGKVIYVGGSGGLMKMDGDKLSAVPGFDGQIAFLHVVEYSPDESAALLVGTPSGVIALSPGGQVRLDSKPSLDAVWSQEMRRVFLLRSDGLFSVTLNNAKVPGAPLDVPFQQDIVKSQKIYGLAELPLEGGSGIAVLTDHGISVFRDEHFEHVMLPNPDRPVGVQFLATRDSRTYMLTSDGVYALERGQAMGDHAGHVYDLLSNDKLGMTFVARGDHLEVIDGNHVEAGGKVFSSIGATHLAQDSQGRLIANDGSRIVRFPSAESTPEDLFDTSGQTVDPRYRPGSVTSILVASDGAIWVTAGASLFRWREEMGHTAEEYSMFKDPNAFPSRSEMLSRVVETFDHHLWVIASNEGHLVWNGMTLSGGVLEWSGKGFRQIAESSKAPSGWFITGYTQIGDSTAIVGTTSGFVRYNGTSYETYRNLKDASYDLLFKRTPVLWLGTRGAKLGDDTWLFGTAGGVVGYRQGVWFYPDRLNWMLPDYDQFAGKYGVRTVHAISTDQKGHIFAGTDRGLLIYDSGGGDSASFLVSNNQDGLAFAFLEKSKFREETDVLLSGLKKQHPGSTVVKALGEVQADDQAIADIQSRLDGATAPRLRAAEDSKEESARKQTDTGEELRKDLETKRASRLRLLLEIEKENPGLHQMLDFQPLEVADLAQKLDTNDAFVQYLPGKGKLYIHIVTRAGIEIREVTGVDLDELNKRAAHAALLLGPKRSQMPADAIELLTSQTTRDEELLWLYDKLLRPVENDLEGKRIVYLVLPLGPLRLLPFEALLRSREPKPEYAVERFSFGYLPTLYLYQLASNHLASRNSDDLILADPDGSLAGARAEAAAIHKLVGSATEEIGQQASYSNLVQYGPHAKVLHLATHGLMDYHDPADSYLLLADRRMTPVDIMTLSLRDTDLVVLSACESGIGSDGMEYATLARAFVHAGVPSIIASLWRVPDDPTNDLMERFYTHLGKNEDSVAALAAAQREMLNSDNRSFRTPNAWAGFVVFGKP